MLQNTLKMILFILFLSISLLRHYFFYCSTIGHRRLSFTLVIKKPRYAAENNKKNDFNICSYTHYFLLRCYFLKI